MPRRMLGILKSEPVPLLGASLGHGPAFTPVEAPAIAISVGSPVAAALSINGVQNELAMWLAPAARVNDPKVAWTKFLTRDDDVTSVDMRGPEIFLLSHKGCADLQSSSGACGPTFGLGHDIGTGTGRSGDRGNSRRLGRAVCARASRRLLAVAAHSRGIDVHRGSRIAFPGPHRRGFHRSTNGGSHARYFELYHAAHRVRLPSRQ